MKLSIVICTYNRAELLKESINSLINQKATPNNHEIIIVNNNSTDDTLAIAQKLSQESDRIRVVTEKKQGLSYARNRGYMEARGEWVAYLDDDALAAPNWVERILFIIDNYDFDCFGGIYLPWYRSGRPYWYMDRYGSNKHIYDKTGILPQNRYFSGGNCVFKKELLLATDGFPGSLGMKGSKIHYGEENFMQFNLRKRGYKIGFDPELVIDHYVAPYKQNVFWFIKSAYKSGSANWQAYQKKVTLFLLLANLAAIFIFPLVGIIKNFIKLFHKNYYFQNFVIDVFSRSASALGKFVVGIQIYMRGNR